MSMPTFCMKQGLRCIHIRDVLLQECRNSNSYILTSLSSAIVPICVALPKEVMMSIFIGIFALNFEAPRHSA
jgi:hypothetical protein